MQLLAGKPSLEPSVGATLAAREGRQVGNFDPLWKQVVKMRACDYEFEVEYGECASSGMPWARSEGGSRVR